MAFKPRFVVTAAVGLAKFVAGDGLTLKPLLTAGITDIQVQSIVLTNKDSIDRVVSLYVNDGVSDFLVSSVNVTALAGTNGITPAFEMLAASTSPFVNPDGYFDLKAGLILRVGVSTAVAAGSVDVVALAGNY